MELKSIKDSMIYSEKSLTKRVMFASKDQLCFVLNFVPGQTLPVHKHEHSSLFLTVLAGTGEVTVSGTVYPLSQGTSFIVEGQDDFSIPSVSEQLSLLVVISPNPSNELFAKEI